MNPAVTAVLREPRWTDIGSLAALDAALFGADAWSEATWWAEFAARPRRAYVVLVEPGDGKGGPGGALDEAPARILGYAGLDLGGEVADVMTIGVAPGQQGAGHGRRLLDWLLATADAAGARHLLLEVRADNAAALALYTGAGFVHISRRRRYYQPDDVDALILRKDLSA